MIEDTKLRDRVERLLDDQLFDYFRDAEKTYGTSDLVIFAEVVDEDLGLIQLLSEKRTTLIQNKILGEEVTRKISVPAPGKLKVRFWLIVTFDEEAVVLPISAERMSPGGES